jgi:hypothetical protein
MPFWNGLETFFSKHPMLLALLTIVIGNVLLSPFTAEIRKVITVFPVVGLRSLKRNYAIVEKARLQRIHGNTFELVRYIADITSSGFIFGVTYGFVILVITTRTFLHPLTVHEFNPIVPSLLAGMVSGTSTAALTISRTLGKLGGSYESSIAKLDKMISGN